LALHTGYYLIDALKSDGLVLKELPNVTEEIIAQNIEDGECIGMISDSSLLERFGLPNTKLPAKEPAPYGLPVAKGNTELAEALSAAMVAMLDQGAESELLALEQEYLVSNGLPANPYLAEQVAELSAVASAPAPAPAASSAYDASKVWAVTGILAVMIINLFH
jgi:ABC-type amino acid transport substrate-binding protein